MPDLQFSRSGHSNNTLSNDQYIASFKNKNVPASRQNTKKPINKCLQNNLIYAMYLPLLFENQDVLKSQNHFGQYGNIQTIIYAAGNTMKNDDQHPDHVQAYVTFNNEKQAAIAIIAVNAIPYETKIIRTTYGTNRMCNSFYTGGKCTVRNCFYLHDQKKCINIQGPLKTDFQKQKNIALQIVKKNLSYYINKIQELKQAKNQPKAGDRNCNIIKFPSVQETINTLFEDNTIPKATYKHAYQQYLNTKKKMSDSVKKIEYIRYKKKPEPISSQPNKQNNTSIQSTIQNQQVLTVRPQSQKILKDNSTQELKCQFLMSPILKSLDQFEISTRKKYIDKKKLSFLKQFQILKENSDPLSIYWQFLDQKDDCSSDLLETEESETQKENLQFFPLQSIEKRKESTRKYSSPQFPTDNCNVLMRLKQEIKKSPLMKKSRLQFAKTTSVLQKKKQYEKITALIKNSLIQ